MAKKFSPKDEADISALVQQSLEGWHSSTAREKKIMKEADRRLKKIIGV